MSGRAAVAVIVYSYKFFDANSKSAAEQEANIFPQQDILGLIVTCTAVVVISPNIVSSPLANFHVFK